MLDALGYEAAGPNGFWVFVLVTLLAGGGAAWRTGHAVAQSWGSVLPLIGYAALLAAAGRFLQFALFDGPLLSIASYLWDLAILVAIAFLGHRLRRVRQMCAQYSWMVERVGPFGWRRRPGV